MAVAMCVCGWQAGLGSLLPCSAARIPQIAKQKKREAKARREAEAAEIRKRLDELVRGCNCWRQLVARVSLVGACVCARNRWMTPWLSASAVGSWWRMRTTH